MRTSLFVRPSIHPCIGKEDWWPLEVLQFASNIAIGITAKYGRGFPRPPDFVPIITVRSLEDMARMVEQSKFILAFHQRQVKEIEDILRMPHILEKRPEVSETLETLMDAADRFQEVGKVARQMAGASLSMIECDPEVSLADPGFEHVVTVFKLVLREQAEHFVAYVESIPSELKRILSEARQGQANVSLRYVAKVNTERITEAIETMHVLRGEDQPHAGPRAGKVYALINPSMPGLIKVGKTSRQSELRADELNTTGVPTPFIVLYEVDVADCDEAERRVHSLLSPFRISEQREFFRVAPKIAVDIISSL